MKRSLALLLFLAASARAQDAAEFLDLSSLRAPAPPETFPRLFVPSDPWIKGFSNEGPEPGSAFETQPAPYDDYVISPGVLASLIGQLVPEYPVLEERPGGPRFTETPERAARVVASLTYLREAMARPLPVSASLFAADGGDGSRLVAAGGAELAPRRWTQLFFQKSVRGFVVSYDVQVSQEAVAAAPVLSLQSEGAELYLRFTPGETVSLLEILVCAVDHLHPFAVDLSAIRNVPESSTMGKIELPRSAVRRTYAVLLVPAGRASNQTISWEGPGGGRTLSVRAGALPASPPDLEVEEGLRKGILRAGALLAPLSEQQRPHAMDQFLERYAGADEMPAPDSLASCWLFAEGPKEKMEAFRALVVREEGRLRGAVVELRAVAVPETPLREAMASGKLALGGGMTPAQVGALVEAAGVPICSARMPLLAGVRASVRAGASVAMLTGADAVVAQQAGGLQPRIAARFEGLAASIVAARAPDGGWRLEIDGSLAWARPDGSVAELAFRPPVGMAFSNAGAKKEETEIRRVPLPIGAYGEAALGAAANLSDEEVAEGRTLLLAVVSSAGRAGFSETVVVTATVTSP